MAHKLRPSLRVYKAKVVNYKNLMRYINRIIDYKDAHIIVSTMNGRQVHYPNYSFEFNFEDDILDAMFWVDEREKTNYAEFGDVISFDMNFQTNKYVILCSF
uniref:Protein FAR1-RELATED SEQUENCE n=1 Tax=Lactuca sativa TaxID=4236 RepID=A0A9R1XNN8_LACSA|nr:hypothetical protein LSAT_V11C200072060 [Lactuca sativa]